MTLAVRPKYKNVVPRIDRERHERLRRFLAPGHTRDDLSVLEGGYAYQSVFELLVLPYQVRPVHHNVQGQPSKIVRGDSGTARNPSDLS